MIEKTTKRERELKKYLTSITMNVRAFVALLDVEMLKPSDHAKGKRIAALRNELELKNDIAMRFGLGLENHGGKVRKIKR